jgi:short-subunit dehydrogenase involved in D-alanine esterification of teichoic acids
MHITGNTVFIPGGTSGIGLALAVALHERGNTVVVGGRRAAVLEQIAADHPGIGTVVVDTTDPASVAEACAHVIAAYPEVNVLVTMAGIMQAEDWRTAAGFLASAEQTVTTNVLGPIRLIAGFVEHLQTRPDATIMTVSSGLAFAPLAGTPSYNATKAAIHQLSESIRLQLAGTSVRVVEHPADAGARGQRGRDAAGRVRRRGARAGGGGARRHRDPRRGREVPPVRRGARRLREGGRGAEPGGPARAVTAPTPAPRPRRCPPSAGTPRPRASG